MGGVTLPPAAPPPPSPDDEVPPVAAPFFLAGMVAAIWYCWRPCLLRLRRLPRMGPRQAGKRLHVPVALRLCAPRPPAGAGSSKSSKK